MIVMKSLQSRIVLVDDSEVRRDQWAGWSGVVRRVGLALSIGLALSLVATGCDNSNATWKNQQQSASNTLPQSGTSSTTTSEGSAANTNPQAALKPQQVERKLGSEGGWAITSAPQLGTPAADIHLAREALGQGRTDEAYSRADDFIKKYPNNDLVPEAYLIRADALFAEKDYYKSLYDYEAICRLYPGAEAFQRALEQEYKIASMFASGMRRKFWGIRFMTAYDEAEELLIRIQERAPGSKLAERAARRLADFYYDRRNMPLASDMYDIYLKNFPNAADHAQAMERLIFSELATYKGPAFDFSGLEEATGWLDILKARYPAESQQIGADALQQRIQEANAERMLVDARWYLGRHDDVSAKFILNRLLNKYGPTLAGRQAYQIMKDHGWTEAEKKSEPTTSPATGTDSGHKG